MDHRAIIAGGGTGGHLYPALNLAEALARRAKRGGESIDVLLVGAQRGVEARVLAERGVPHRLLPLEPIHRSRPWRNWRLVPSAFASSRAILRLFREFEPDLVVGTGGYAAGPVVAWALLRGLPTAIQEQNSYPGLTTRWLAPYVDQIHLGYGEAMRMLWPGPNTDVRVHGNPIRWPEERPHPEVVRQEFGLGPGRVVLVIGGSQGAAPLNEALLAALGVMNAGRLPPLPADAQLLWATGPAHFKEVRRRLEPLRGRVAVRTVPYISEVERALSITSLAVSRAGALALSELCAWGVPSVLVPLPHAAADHQRMNARSLAADGAAVVVEERDMRNDPGSLWQTIVHLLQGATLLEEMGAASQARGRPRAADAIADDLWRLMEDR
ncbi:MAG: UDP-N-acetylglucosamine--N-acetylmuramyl-(pentapeptide) pyrophosphoryl-undecaprenol N-acetylglucosamine transferase [Gemmatimonadetes bacterium]|uniref:UDP-N-acetylglucosamine--N-acetylmuramyl-(pentapeptide) pyrophosphoryl-undecaprenol N-acetylglucosamine transferase n=1 Tax=Candidatus Kutchimonas denitrificans TaxID=3056748 RepID=A0AAE5CCR5_9BACT|nr:UDP-N-acetylglucosamine--N-acetylmuramyl-(pentapeptide) pyrophosphoryl-undecaprenol N-acetylglucosamine transferase [Gemmatimonadota bacterium]NIR74549.1 UDP-N-acetylglucosamine--N-acetylmuramyl-(pentapeptide) pyrophosphoryl-undecaprenol N-acetylglucosamine transferase [Candidatus Kutchimonas denitrificans]NIS02739.1 UDP-N-acetylglucosamine--N-acetylmuramyl-(pentapeptide) pyrophosphoryl-undecaprenol N-acetylglucosamine transferase [Gemmatimonadota bacterium]NIT68900.1 UDP-N-acetylglucosamine-